jgi:hypothetical protein
MNRVELAEYVNRVSIIVSHYILRSYFIVFSHRAPSFPRT